jgi:hypothetical protein
MSGVTCGLVYHMGRRQDGVLRRVGFIDDITVYFRGFLVMYNGTTVRYGVYESPQ